MELTKDQTVVLASNSKMDAILNTLFHYIKDICIHSWFLDILDIQHINVEYS